MYMFTLFADTHTHPTFQYALYQLASVLYYEVMANES